MTALTRLGVWIGAVLLLGNAAMHLYLFPRYLHRHPVIGVLFVLLSLGLIAVTAGIAIGLPGSGISATLLQLADLVCFVLSRTVGLFGYHDHDWTEVHLGLPMGTLTMVSAVGFALLWLALALARGTIDPFARWDRFAWLRPPSRQPAT